MNDNLMGLGLALGAYVRLVFVTDLILVDVGLRLELEPIGKKTRQI